jgi:xanthine dehydrogenase YagS FAD-binding subunit
VINLAVACDRENNYRIALGGVAPAPYVADKAEALLKGRAMTPELAEEAGLAAAGGSRALEQNAYKAQLIKTLVKRELAQLAISFVSAAR